MDYKIFIDENLPQHLADGLNILQKPLNNKEENIEILSIKNYFGQGALDENWIPEIGRLKGVVITQDFKIHSQKHQRELYKIHKVGMIFISSTSKKVGLSYWKMVEILINNWSEIKTIIVKYDTPFAFRLKKSKFEKLD